MNPQSERLDENATTRADDEVAVTDDPGDDGGYDDDADFAPKPRAGIGRLTTALLIGIGLVAAFGGGAYVQKSHGSSSSTVATGFPGGGARAGGAEGGFAGFGPNARTGTAGGANTTNGTAGSSTTSGSAASVPAVIGTVVKVSGRTVTVKNLGGKTIKVTVPAGVTVTKASTLTLADLAEGSSVTVVGTTGADGTVTATGVTAR